MNEKDQLKVQALVDGELSPRQARATERWVQSDADAAALLTELRQTSSAVRLNQTAVALPESREFYWSKIQRDIRQIGQQDAIPRINPVFALWRRILFPLS